jgi:hypothetical protein
MRSMESFPNNLQIHKSAISLCQELIQINMIQIYTDIAYDSNKWIQLVINSLFTFKDKDIVHLSVKLFPSLVLKLSESGTKQLFLVENSINDSNTIFTFINIYIDCKIKNFFQKILF